MNITATELKNNVSKYLILSKEEDVFVTKNGKVISKLTNPYKDRVERLKGIFGCISSDLDVDAVLEERINKIWKH